jgi:stage II sporulation protein D
MTVTVGLFTTGAVHGVTITPLNQQAWRQDCDSCSRTALRSSTHIDHINASIRFSGALRIQSDGNFAPVEALGIYRIEPSAAGLRVTLQMPSESYVAAVLNGEAAADEPPASLEALAVIARTFALSNQGRHHAEGFDLCDSTHCQALRISHIRPAIMQAVRNTAGITLWSGSRRASVYYTQHCGGIAEAASAIWPTERKLYLASHADPYCMRRSPARWQADIPITALSEIASREHWRFPPHLSSVSITQHTTSGRARLLAFSGSGISADVSATSLRFAINRALGWNRLRSDLYSVSIAGDHLHFSGTGYGHGVGLCQAGAFQMALEHHTAAEILEFYFPGTHIGLTPTEGTWQSQTIGAIHLRTVEPEPELTRDTQQAWQRAISLFPPVGETPQPTIILAPTTELFRQISFSPGYLLAVTRGEQITLQPMSILQRNGPLEPLLLHELLHVLIEKQSTDKAPLWLREGLVEALTTLDKPFTGPTDSLSEIEQELASSSSQSASLQTHRDAAAIVRTLGHTYSIDVMRAWLRNGVPSEVLQQIR